MLNKSLLKFFSSYLNYFYLKFKYKFIRKLNYKLLKANFDVINGEPFIGTKLFVLSEEECNHIRSLASDKLKKSKVNESSNNKYSKIRSSRSSTLNYYDDHLTLNVVKRISKMVGIKHKNIPAIEVSHYRVGEFFATHPDAFQKFYFKKFRKR